MQSKAGGAAGAVGFESNLGIDDFEEEIMLALRKNLELWLAGGLGE